MEKPERVLMRKVMAIGAEVETILKKEFSVQWFKPSAEDSLRLLILGQWRERYRISVTQILRWLIPIWREQFTKFSQGKGIGVSISTLTGKKSEEILKERIGKEFPEQEHLARWKSQEQQRQWEQVCDRGVVKEDWEHPRAMVAAYQKRVQSERRLRKKFAQEQQKRNYRGNPWIG